MIRTKKKYPGQNMHLEYHTVDRKREKPADCIYMTDNRECQCRESPCFLSKCFVATSCKYRVKSAEAKATPSPVKTTGVTTTAEDNDKKYWSIKCNLPLRCRVWSGKYGEGVFVGFVFEDRVIRVSFAGRIRSFKYPESILEEEVRVTAENYKIVLSDLNRLCGKKS